VKFALSSFINALLVTCLLHLMRRIIWHESQHPSSEIGIGIKEILFWEFVVTLSVFAFLQDLASIGTKLKLNCFEQALIVDMHQVRTRTCIRFQTSILTIHTAQFNQQSSTTDSRRDRASHRNIEFSNAFKRRNDDENTAKRQRVTE
jgi:hypothetical protein